MTSVSVVKCCAYRQRSFSLFNACLYRAYGSLCKHSGRQPSGQRVTGFTCQLSRTASAGVWDEWTKRKYSVSTRVTKYVSPLLLSGALQLAPVIWSPLRWAKWLPFVGRQSPEFEATISPQCDRSDYDIIFLQGFTESQFTQ